MVNRLLKKMANDFDAESSFITHRMSTYENIINKYEQYFSDMESKAKAYRTLTIYHSDDIIGALGSAYNMANSLQRLCNKILELNQKIELELPEIRKMINKHNERDL